jgi:aspartate aminotransferase
MIADNLSPAIEAALASQERYEQICESAYRRSGSSLCDLGYANFHDGPSPAVLAAIRECLNDAREPNLQYSRYGGMTITRRLIAERLRRSHGLAFDWRELILTPGAMAALNLLFRALKTDSSTGEVIVLTPCWLDYPLYLENLGLRPVLVPLNPRNLRIDLDRVADSMTESTRAIVLSQPANPTGLIYSPEELDDLAGAMRAHQGRSVLLISDECHRDFVLEPNSFRSPAEFYENTCVVYSFGKAFKIQGQRIGYIAVSPRMEGVGEFVRLLERLCRVTGLCTPTALMQLAVRGLLDLQADISVIARRRDVLLQALLDAGYEVEPSQATYFLYPRSPEADDFQFAAWMAQQGLLVLPAPLFHHQGHFRLCLTARDSSVARAADVLTRAARQLSVQ